MRQTKLLQACRHLVKKEPVLAVSFLLALLACLAAPRGADYLSFLDTRTLALLFCLMAVVAGLEQAGLFSKAAYLCCARVKSLRALGFLLCGCCFFSSMLITNDVALITFVPFAILVLEQCGQQRHAAYLIVLQTVAANLGSVLTPVGNPQNLYLYSRYELSAPAFFSLTVPLVAAGGVLICLLLLPLPRQALSLPVSGLSAPALPRRRVGGYLLLFALCLLAVFRVLPVSWVFALIFLLLLCCDRAVLRRVDYPLLATFVCFFLFVGSMGEIPAVRLLMSRLLAGRELPVSALVSQVISNVPAAVMLSGFTGAWPELLLGVNIGGLGTPVASLASLISLKYFSRHYHNTGRYLRLFLQINISLLILLLAGAVFLLPYGKDAMLF